MIKSSVERRRANKTRAHVSLRVDQMPRLALDDLHYEVECRKVLVVGSARLERPLDREPDELVVCVNGGISTFPGVADFWVVNSRANARFFTNERLRMHKLMMDQCSRRFIETVVFVTRAEGSEQVTALWMEERGCGWRRSMLLDPGARAMVERDSGGRIKGMERQTASLGLTTVALFLWAGALRVRLRGFSRTAGYEYLPKDAPVDQRWRAHLSADIGMMEHLLKRHGERVQGYGMREA